MLNDQKPFVLFWKKLTQQSYHAQYLYLWPSWQRRCHYHTNTDRYTMIKIPPSFSSRPSVDHKQKNKKIRLSVFNGNDNNHNKKHSENAATSTSVTFTLVAWPWPFVVKVKKADVIRCHLLYCTLVPAMMSMGLILYEISPFVNFMWN